MWSCAIYVLRLPSVLSIAAERLIYITVPYRTPHTVRVHVHVCTECRSSPDDFYPPLRISRCVGNGTLQTAVGGIILVIQNLNGEA